MIRNDKSDWFFAEEMLVVTAQMYDVSASLSMTRELALSWVLGAFLGSWRFSGCLALF